VKKENRIETPWAMSVFELVLRRMHGSKEQVTEAYHMA